MNWNVTGHDWAVKLLQGHLAQNSVRHAYLLTGPAGVGKRTLALEFIRTLNCLQPPVPGQPCGTCRVCRQTAEMQHIDLSVTQAEPGGTLKVEAVRDLQRALSLSPREARYRVALLLNFHQATPSAQNALLKTLEEAPQRVILLLTAASAEDVLPTILSRCEVLRLRPMPLEQAQAELQQRGLEAEDARLLAHLSDGRLGTAITLRDHPELREERSLRFEEMLNLLGETRRARFLFAERANNDLEKDQIRELYSAWLSFWRDVMLVCAAGGRATPQLVNLDLEPQIQTVAASVDLPTALARTADLEQALARLDANVNTRMLTEVLLLDWPVLRGLVPEESLDGEP